MEFLQCDRLEQKLKLAFVRTVSKFGNPVSSKILVILSYFLYPKTNFIHLLVDSKSRFQHTSGSRNRAKNIYLEYLINYQRIFIKYTFAIYSCYNTNEIYIHRLLTVYRKTHVWLTKCLWSYARKISHKCSRGPNTPGPQILQCWRRHDWNYLYSLATLNPVFCVGLVA